MKSRQRLLGQLVAKRGGGEHHGDGGLRVASAAGHGGEHGKLWLPAVSRRLVS
jgi:hypothetical protein